MATYTTNLNLKKPAYSDTRDIGDINDNMDLIDTAVNGKKTKQTAKTDPTASGTAVAFIDSITQNANGEITATKKTVRTISRSNTGLCPAPPSGSGTTKYLREDGSWSVPPDTTYSNATTSAAGLMSSADKTKLNGIAAGAQPGTVTGVKVNGATNSPTSGTVDIGSVATGVKVNGTTKTPTSGTVDIGSVATGVKVNGITKSPTSGTVDIGSVATGVKVNGTTKTPTSGTVDIGSVATGVKVNGTTKTPTSGTVNIGSVATGVKMNGDTITPVSGTVDIGSVATGVKINGTTKTPTSGTVDIGTVVTPSTVTNNSATMNWNTMTTLATIGGVDIKAKIPANPNTNTWRGFEVKQWSASYSISSGGSASLNGSSFAAITPTGYTPVAVLKISTGNASVDVARFDGGAGWDDEMLKLRWNGSSSGSVSTTAYIKILYLQNG